jgi:hypothetical protein
MSIHPTETIPNQELEGVIKRGTLGGLTPEIKAMVAKEMEVHTATRNAVVEALSGGAMAFSGKHLHDNGTISLSAGMPKFLRSAIEAMIGNEPPMQMASASKAPGRSL